MIELVGISDVTLERPATSELSEYAPLMALLQCWESVRGDRMIPTKRDFEGAILDYPEVLPHMTLLERFPADGIRFRFVGSQRVYQQGVDPTFAKFEQSFAPDVRRLMVDWAAAALENPIVAFWKTRSELASGRTATNVTLSVVLSDKAGRPTYIASVVVLDDAVSKEVERGGHLIGSNGVEFVPIDIGNGVPDLPLSSD